jgi:hypothetical protein
MGSTAQATRRVAVDHVRVTSSGIEDVLVNGDVRPWESRALATVRAGLHDVREAVSCMRAEGLPVGKVRFVRRRWRVTEPVDGLRLCLHGNNLTTLVDVYQRPDSDLPHPHDAAWGIVDGVRNRVVEAPSGREMTP